MAKYKINEGVSGLPDALKPTVEADFFEIDENFITFSRFGDPNFEVFAIRQSRVEVLKRIEE